MLHIPADKLLEIARLDPGYTITYALLRLSAVQEDVAAALQDIERNLNLIMEEGLNVAGLTDAAVDKES